MRTRPAIATVPALLLGLGVALAAPQDLEPAPAQGKAAQEVVARLTVSHYRRQAVDDALSARVLDRYLEFLDPGRSLFLGADAAEFGRYRRSLDDALKAGDLEPAFVVFRRYQERQGEQLTFLLEAARGDLEALTFDGDEVLELDRSEAPWPADRAALEGLWRRRFLNDVLSLELAGRSREEIAELLERRYSNQQRLAGRTNAEDVFQVFLNALTQSYDPHTAYFGRKTAQDFDIEMSLKVEGIGALLGQSGEYVRIERLIPGGPAEKGGALTAGDRIASVAQGEDGEEVDVVGWRTDEVADLVRGPAGSTVRLGILGADQPDGGVPREVVIVREAVKIEEQAARSEIVTVEGEDGATRRIGVIELPTFYMDFAAYARGEADFKSSTRDVAALLQSLEAAGVDGVVLDLRDNGGGSLMEAADLTGLFLGRRAVVQVRSAGGEVQALPASGRAVFGGPLLVLVNRLSASASEIFAGAVQDWGRGLVAGAPTFGKGSVQTLVPLSDGELGELKLTQAMFYRVTGASTQQRGVVPDIAFPSAYDPSEIGEDTLPESLPWDEIEGLRVPKERRRALEQLLPELRRRHGARAADDPDFRYLAARLAYLERMRAHSELSLNLEARRAERAEREAELLAIVNAHRAAHGLDPVESADAAAADMPTDEEVDAYQREGARVLADLLELGSRER